jgi:hypothetical protein
MMQDGMAMGPGKGGGKGVLGSGMKGGGNMGMMGGGLMNPLPDPVVVSPGNFAGTPAGPMGGGGMLGNLGGMGVSVGANMPVPVAPMAMPRMSAAPQIKPGPQRRHTGNYKSREFVFTSHHDGNGIIFFMGLNRKEGKWYNPVDTRKLRVIASSLDSGTLPMTVDQEFNELLYASKDEYPSWVVFDFLECSVRPTYYSLAHKGILQSYMRSWKFEGSNDAASWETLCIHTNDISLSKQNTVASWAVKTQMAYRYLRIMLEQGGNSEGGSALLFNAFEVYGDLKIPVV